MEPSPAWLNGVFFEHVLQSEERSKGRCSSVSVVRCSPEPGVDAGCNFLSTIVRVRVDYTINGGSTQTQSFLIKAPLSDKVLNEDILVKNELQMYNEVLPKMAEISQLQISPKRYSSPNPECLVMEDLKAAGYVMCDSNKKLDCKHAKATLLTLAKFHAASVAVKRECPEVIGRNGEETVYTHNPKYADRFKPRVLMRLYGVAKVLQTIDGCEQFGETLLDAGEAFWDLIVEVFRPHNKLNVLNHGDLWTNNLLFKYDNAGCVADVKLVDYQLRRYCSPAIDLLYLFWTSADDGVRMRMYELLEMYRHTLNNSLSELSCPERLSRHQLKEEISKCSPIILLLCLYLPVIFPDPDDPFDVSQVEASEETMTSPDFDVNPILFPFKRTYYRKALPEMCKELETMKIFQILRKNRKPIIS